MASSSPHTSASPPPPSEPAAILERARRLVALGEEHELRMRVLGGVAVALRAAPRTPPALLRTGNDIDLAVEEGEGRRAGAVLGESGLVALSERFNAVQGHRRLVFVEPHDPTAKVDVFVGDLEMCHVVPLRRRLGHDPLTLSPTDLLLSKGQIAQLSAKDRLDLYCLLWNHDVDADYVAALCARDWGWWRTLGANLTAAREALPELAGLADEDRAPIDARLRTLEQALAAAPKSLRWRARSRLGDRVRWYEEPEEIDAPAAGAASAISS
ncbi:MAG TPA: hypothetical protein VMU32_04045 [Solirubrobacteraceae bacterium]|nr:hypothetical protein [Solirubrobacteraceae bacterium]